MFPVKPTFPSTGVDRRSFLKLAAFALVARPVLASSPERTLAFHNLHTLEKLKTVYWAEGQYIPEALADINRVLRDHRTGQIHDIDLQLLDLLSGLRLKMETTAPFEIISGYRSPATNTMLRSSSSGVAENSLHVKGMAADIRVSGRSLATLRKTAMEMKAGGVGYYPASQFVHVDVGRVRYW
jgi:uncharacterized protein YcbK (DUF882 family)